METLKFDLAKKYGKFKLLNCVGGGPLGLPEAGMQNVSNYNEYVAARIPYSRNHDLNLCSTYDGPYAHDISAIFPDFDADANDPLSYDFACTDYDVNKTIGSGTKVFYRLGQSIEHSVKKHNVYPPKDFEKWASICEHIIRHFTEGWANGFTFDIPYWEIWNEPDLYCDEKDLDKKPTWCGTEKQFFDLYEITAKHLKKCFPQLKIGGPALASDLEWAERFLSEMQKRKVPVDFFSWHCYSTDPSKNKKRAEGVRKLLDKYGYENAESILNEWNYVKGWQGEDELYSVKARISEKGAAFIMANIAAAQKYPVDMLMYYDVRPSRYNGIFDFFSRNPLKGYYPMFWYGTLYDCESEVRAADPENIYSLCGVAKDGKITAIVTYFNDDDLAPEKEIKLDFGKDGAAFTAKLVDKDHFADDIAINAGLSFKLKNNSVLYIKEV